MLGTFALSSGYYDAYYKKALQVRTLIMEEYKKSFETCQFIDVYKRQYVRCTWATAL